MDAKLNPLALDQVVVRMARLGIFQGDLSARF